jgi:DNA processing protein
MEERVYWLGFSSFHGIGPTKFNMLLEMFWTAENAWNATETELLHSGIGDKTAQKFLDFRKQFHLESYAEQLAKAHVSYLIQDEKAYPQLLKQIINSPYVLYTKGNASLLHQDKDERLLAIVGTRKVTDYGRHITETLANDLSIAGCVIVSGLAMGVDAIAHAATLRAKGKTIAILGCGVDCCTPKENENLYEQIIAGGGLIVSEAPLSQQSFKGSFPSRNRIIAGLSLGVLVTEGAEDSGSLITAKEALKSNRLVFAVPGPITSSVSRGPIALIQDGAKMVTEAKDILDAIGLQNIQVKLRKEKIQTDNKEEQTILDILENEQMQFDELVKRTGIASSQLGTILSLMEMKGWILGTDNGAFIIAL